MSNNVDLSVLLSSYLEEENLRLLLPRLCASLKSMNVKYEIVVIDTLTSMDGTPEVCEQNSVNYINRSGGNSFGDAVRSGIVAARGKHVLFMDADGSHSPEFIPNMYEHVGLYDVIVASRYIEGGCTENSRILVLMSRVLNIIYSVVLGIKCRDVSNSFKIYNRNLLRGLRLNCNNFDVVEELLYKVSKKHRDLRIKEVPFVFKKRMFGNTKRNLFAFMVSYLYTLIKLRFGK